MKFAQRVKKGIREYMLTPRGRNVLTFCVFLLISAILWVVMSLNVSMQLDMQCRLKLVHCPDSMVLVSDMPDDINVSVRAKGTRLMSYMLGRRPTVEINYMQYCRKGIVNLSRAELRNISHLTLGQEITVTATAPDTLNLLFTSRPPVQLPVVVEASITTKPNCELNGPVRTLTDSVLLYSYKPLSKNLKEITTQPIRLDGVSASRFLPAKLNVPEGCRAVPDSVMVAVEIEPMIARQIPVVVRSLNVPTGKRLILLPTKVNVKFLQPMSVVDRVVPRFTVVADYSTIDPHENRKIKLSLLRVEGNVSSVRLSVDSVDYRIENR